MYQKSFIFLLINDKSVVISLQLFSEVKDPTGLSLFEDGGRSSDKQETHSLEAAKLTEHKLKSTLEKLALHLFGKGL